MSWDRSKPVYNSVCHLAATDGAPAARAGDAGKGFAVVAEEVRNLAMRSTEAAKSTANLIEGSIGNAEGGVSINKEVLEHLVEINGQIRQVNEVMAEIEVASDGQSSGIERINSAVDNLKQSTQLVASNAQESASTAEELSAQAEEMKHMVGSFK